MEPRPEGRGECWTDERIAKELGMASMEPRPEGRGEWHTEVCPMTYTESLQWSHVPKDVERMQLRQQLGLIVLPASMEPRPEGRGELVRGRRAHGKNLASMEPRPEGRGEFLPASPR